MVMCENIRCSILFHLLVPGGKWQTVRRKPRRSANSCNAPFLKRDRLPLLPPPPPPAVLEIPDQFLLFRVHRHARLTSALELPHPGVDVLELRVAVGMRHPFPRLAIGLEAVTRLLQQRPHLPRTRPELPPPQFLGQSPRTLAGPGQRRLRVPPRRGLHQQLQRGQNPRLRLLDRLAPGAGAPSTLRGKNRGRVHPLGLHFPDALVNRLAGQARRRRHRRDPPPAAPAVPPPQPNDRASVAAHRLRNRSFIAGDRLSYFPRIHSTTHASCIYPITARSPQKANFIYVRFLTKKIL